MAISLNQIRARGQQIAAKQPTATSLPPKKRSLAPWEEATSSATLQKQVEAPSQETAAPAQTSVASTAAPAQVNAASPAVSVQVTTTKPALDTTKPALDPSSAVDPIVKREVKTAPEKVEVFAKPKEELVPEKPKAKETATQPSENKLKAIARPVATSVAGSIPVASPNEGEFAPSFSQLLGIQRKIVLYVFTDCISKGSLESSPITIEHFSDSLSVPYHSIKKSIDRLQARQILERAKFKAGRGGWTQYRLSRPVYQELSRLNREGLLPIVSSDGSIKTPASKLETTGDKPPAESALGEDWQGVDTSPLSHIGFGKAHILQLARDGKLTPELVQDSIHHFAFDLNKNDKAKELRKSPLEVLMGILRNRGPYSAPANYESPEAAAMRQYLEKKRAAARQAAEMEKEIFELEFSSWKAELKPSELSALLPGSLASIPQAREPVLLEHFRDNLWPQRRAELPISSMRFEVAKAIDESLNASVPTL